MSGRRTGEKKDIKGFWSASMPSFHKRYLRFLRTPNSFGHCISKFIPKYEEIEIHINWIGDLNTIAYHKA
jgi:hypothetical protein